MAFGEVAGWFYFFSDLPRSAGTAGEGNGGGGVLPMASENVRVSGRLLQVVVWVLHGVYL